MKYKDLKEQFDKRLEHLYAQQESSEMFFVVLEQVESSTRMQFLEKQQTEVSADTQSNILDVLKELEQGKPIQYIFEEAYFYRLIFKVNASVLIPRDETEELVDLIVRKERKEGAIPKRVLDVGTGSGCIALSIKKNLPWMAVSALDVSEEALAVAKENALRLNLSVDFIHADILQYSTPTKYDIIVSNPPYVKENERADMHVNVLSYEPATALFVSDQDPLIFYRTIADFARLSLVEGGSLYFEINEYLGPEMVMLMEEKGFSEVRLIQDLQQKNRMLSCVL